MMNKKIEEGMNLQKKQGFKIFRIKSRREVPKPEEIKEKIEFLLDTDHFYTELTLKDW